MDLLACLPLCLLCSALVFACPVPTRAADSAPVSAAAIMAELRAVTAQRELWPGYDPLAMPVAIFDGANTYLFHHPAPPADFTPSADDPQVAVYPGRHPLVVANTAVDLGGVSTATFMPNVGAGGTARADAAVIAHEAFHVYEYAQHPSWSANEAELFTFPKGDPVWLAARRLEQEAYLAALAAPETQSCQAGVAQALAQREVWAGVFTPEQHNYVRELERMEGLAAYLQTVVEHPDAPDPSILGNSEFRPAEARRWAYYMGTLQALLLDRLVPDWRVRLEADDTQYLADMLAVALPAGSPPAALAPGQLAQAQAQAQQASADYAAGLVQQRADFDALPGWRVIVMTEITPLAPQGFDPMNVANLGGGELLHLRFLRLGNPVGALELMGGQALTFPAGEHPLFSGIARAEFHGLAAEPLVYEDERCVRLTCDNFTLEFSPASLERTGEQEYTVHVLGPQPGSPLASQVTFSH
jgi:hypothetical protein